MFLGRSSGWRAGVAPRHPRVLCQLEHRAQVPVLLDLPVWLSHAHGGSVGFLPPLSHLKLLEAGDGVRWGGAAPCQSGTRLLL